MGHLWAQTDGVYLVQMNGGESKRRRPEGTIWTLKSETVPYETNPYLERSQLATRATDQY